MLDGYTKLFKRFKDGFFRVVVTLVGQFVYYDDADSPKFHFDWDSNPSRLSKMSKDSLSVESRWVVDILEQLPNKISRKRIVCCYLNNRHGCDVCGTFCAFVFMVFVLI